MGEGIVTISIWIALLCYPAGPIGLAKVGANWQRIARIVWTLGGLAFLIHVASSFEVFYEWSHATALRETARQVAELTGRTSGVGLYLNYLFTLIWIADALWWWRDEAGYSRRSNAINLWIHGFFLFMIFNATVVFEDGATRVLGLGVTAAGCWGLWSSRRSRRVAP